MMKISQGLPPQKKYKLDPDLQRIIDNCYQINKSKRMDSQQLIIQLDQAIQERQSDNCISLKFLIIDVGNTCFLTQFSNQQFQSSTQPTIGIDIIVKQLKVNNRLIKLFITDTAGQEKFRAVTSSYYRDAYGILLCYDITNKSTFQNLDIWLNEIQRYGHKNESIILVGNKSDLKPQRQVSVLEGQSYAQSRNILFIEASAYNGENIERAFEMVITQFFEKVEKGQIQLPQQKQVIKVRYAQPEEEQLSCLQKFIQKIKSWF